MNINEQLNQAIKNQDLNSVKIIMKNVEDINSVDNMGQTALMWACQTENIEMVKYLIKEGANINYINNFKETALTQACDIENEKIIKVLLDNNMFIRDTNNYGEEIEKLQEAEENLKLVQNTSWFKTQKQKRKDLKLDIKNLTTCDDEKELKKLIKNIAQKRDMTNETLALKDVLKELKNNLDNVNDLISMVQRFDTRIKLGTKKAVLDTIDFLRV